MPTVPAAHFVVVRADLLLRLLEARLDGPTVTRDPNQFLKRRTRLEAAEVISVLMRIAA